MCNGSFASNPTSICERISWHITFWQWHYHIFRTTKSTWTFAHTCTLYKHTHTHASKSHHWSEIRKKILFLCLHLPKRQKLKSTQKNNRTTRNEKGLLSMGNWWMAKYNLSAIFHMFFLYIQCRKVVHGTCVSHWKLLTVLVHLSCFDNTLRALIFNNTPYCFHFETNWIKSKSLCEWVSVSWIKSRFFYFQFLMPSS